MTRWHDAVRARLSAYRTTLLGLATLTALVTAAVGGTFAFVEQSSTQSVQAAPELASGAASVLRVDTRIAPDAAEQDQQARAVIGAKVLEAPVDVLRSVRAEPMTPQSSDSAPGQVVLVADPAIPDHAEITGGRWPQGTGEGALRATAAQALGVDVGQEIVVGDAAVTIVGLWEPLAPTSPFWAMDAVATGPGDEPPFGPVVVDEVTLLAVQDDPFVRWTLLPRVGELTVDDAAVLARGLPALRGSFQASPAQVRGVVETGTLAVTVQGLEAEASTARAVTGVPVVVLLLISLVAVVQVARLLVAVRGRESQILVARGASTGQMGLVAAVEALPCAVGGALVGAGLSWLTVLVAGPGDALTSAAWRWIVLSAAGVALVVVAVLVTVVVLDTRGLARMRAVDAAGRTRTVVGAGALLLLVSAAALAGWRVWRAQAESVPAAEELVVLAPGLLLLTGALVGLVVLAPSVRLGERWAARMPALVPALPARQVARRLTGYAVPALLVALAAGALVLANTYGATTAGLQAQVDAVRSGSDLRVLTGARGSVSPQTTVPVIDLGADGVADSSLVLNTTAEIGDSEVRLFALPADRAKAVLPATGPAAAPEIGQLASTGDVLPGVDLPEGSARLTIGVRGRAGTDARTTADAQISLDGLPLPSAAGGPPVRVSTTLWLADTSGGIVQVPGPTASLPVEGAFDDAVLTEAVTADVDVPAGGPWRIVALDLEVDKQRSILAFQVEATSLEATLGTGETVALGEGAATRWALEEALLGPSLTSLITGEPTVVVQPGPEAGVVAELSSGIAAERVRLRPAGAEKPTELRAVATPGLLDLLDLQPGGTADLRVSGHRVTVRFVGEVAVVPGGLDPLALAVDLDTLHAMGLSARPAPVEANEMWVSLPTGGSVEDAADQIIAAAAPSWTVVTASREVSGLSASSAPAASGSVGAAFWIAGAGALALALAGTWSVLGALARDRRGEVVALRSVGVTARQQERSRGLEVAAIVSFALVVGLVAGLLVARATVGLFARISVPAAPAGLTQAVTVALGPAVLAVSSLVAGAALLAWAHSRTVRRQATDLDHREDAR